MKVYVNIKISMSELQVDEISPFLFMMTIFLFFIHLYLLFVPYALIALMISLQPTVLIMIMLYERKCV